MRRNVAAVAVGLVVASAGEALAQSAPVPIFSTSITQSFQADPTPSVRVDGLLGSQTSPLVSLLVPETIGSPAGQAAVSQVGVALTTAAVPLRVSLSDPRFVGTAPTQRVVDGTPFQVVVTGQNTSTAGAIGIPSGDRGICASPGVDGVLGDGGELPAGCQFNATTTAVQPGEGFILTNTNTPQLVLTGTADVYAVTATPIVQIGTGHALARLGAFQSMDRLTDRILGELADPAFAPGGDRPWMVFVEGYGGYGHVNAEPGRYIPGARTEFGGMTGGFAGVPLPGALVGWVFDVTRIDMATNDTFAPESSRLDLVKTGPFGSYRFGDLTIGLLGVLGRGDTSTSSGSAAAGGIAGANYNMTVATGGGEFSYDLRRLTGVPITPQFGYQYARVETDGFTESGSPFALRGLSGSVERQRVWLGAVWRDSYDVGPLRVEPRAYVRAVNLSGDTDAGGQAILAALPGAGVVNLAGPQTEGWSAQWGIRVRVPLLAGVAQLSYDGQAGAGYNAQVFAARMRFAF